MKLREANHIIRLTDGVSVFHSYSSLLSRLILTLL